MNAYYHVPQVRLMAPLATPLIPGQGTQVTLRIANPTPFPTSVKFLPFAFVPLRKGDNEVLNIGGLETLGTESSTDSLSLTPFSISPATQLIREVTVLPILKESFTFNCHLQPPDGLLILPPKDEISSEYDADPKAPDFNDDPSFISWRRGNTANVVLDIERLPTSEEGEPLTLGLTMEFDYTNYEYMSDSKGGGPQKLRIHAHLLVNLSGGHV